MHDGADGLHHGYRGVALEYVAPHVHACRALGRQNGPAALDAVLASWEDRSRLNSHDKARVKVAQLTALGRLSP